MRIILFIFFSCITFIVHTMEKVEILHEDEKRTYLLFIPETHHNSYNLIVGLHGYSGSASGFQMETTGGFNQYAEEKGIIVAYPQGKYFYSENKYLKSKTYTSSWNHLGPLIRSNPGIKICEDVRTQSPVFPSCQDQDNCYWTSCVDDSDFIKTVTMLLHDRFSIKNTYVMGLSNGGMMAQLMGCTYPKLFDGVINIVGMQPLGMSCIPKSPINLIIYGGALDKSTPPKAIKTSSGYLYEPMLSTLNSWANQFNCKDYKISQLSEPFKTEEMMYFNCNNDVILTSILNKEAGHSWPGITPNEGYCRTNIQSEIIYNECNDISIISGSKYLFDRVFGE